MTIKVGNTTLNVSAFKSWTYPTFVAAYRGILKGDLVSTWSRIQLELSRNETVGEAETIFNTNTDVQKTEIVSGKRKKNRRRKDTGSSSE